MKKYKLGLALGGGGARGFAHLGVIQAMHEQDIYPDVIAGTSAGSIVGAFIAYGKNAQETFDIMKVKDFTDYSKLQLNGMGLFGLKNLNKKIREEIDVKDLKELKLPFFVTVSNLYTGKVEYLNEGPIGTLVTASASIPILFEPVEYNGSKYVDGGLFNNVPSEPLRKDCDKIIAVNVNPISELESIDSMEEMAARIFLLNANSTLTQSDRNADIFIEPPGLDKFDIIDGSEADEMYRIGYDYAKDFDFKKLLEEKKD